MTTSKLDGAYFEKHWSVGPKTSSIWKSKAETLHGVAKIDIVWLSIRN